MTFPGSSNLNYLIYEVYIKITFQFQGYITERIKVSMGTIEILMLITKVVMEQVPRTSHRTILDVQQHINRQREYVL